MADTAISKPPAGSIVAIHYACPCTDISKTPSLDTSNQAEQDNPLPEGEAIPFNPHDSRANFALYPVEHLLFCTECHELRCPRCSYEEALAAFCPSCLQERSGASVRTESNSCPQSCHQCPICSTHLLINRHADTNAPAAADKKPAAGPYILSCPHCSWTSLEAGLIFDYRVNISGQMAEALKQRKASSNRSSAQTNEPSHHFTQLAEFYKMQIEETNPVTSFRSRYTKTSGQLRRQTKPLPVMREAEDVVEGLQVVDLAGASLKEAVEADQTQDDNLISQMANLGWPSTTSLSQRAQQPHPVPLTTQLLPTPTLLHIRRAKRCRMCKHNLLRPADPRSSRSISTSSTTRYRIRQLASSYIPRLTVRPLALQDSSSKEATTTSLATSLNSGKATHYLLTFHNPLYHTLRITLATPRFTPGPVASKTTILCPSFDVAANRDIWDDNAATASSTSSTFAARGGKNTIALKDATGYQQPEAGKVWSTSRNATTVVVEIVPGIVSPSDNNNDIDSDVLKVPVFVRLEYDTTTINTTTKGTKTSTTTSVSGEETSKVADADSLAALEEDARIAGLNNADITASLDDGKRELAYWSVLDFGRIS